MKTTALFLFALLLAMPALAGFRGYSSTTSLGVFNAVTCSTGLTCTKVGDRFNIVSSPTQSGSLSLAGAEATDVALTLAADESDDSGDDWKLSSVAATNLLSFSNDTSGAHVVKFSIAPTGIFTLVSDDTLSNATDDSLIFASNDEHSIFQVKGFEAKDASIQLYADEGDDSADKFGLKYSAAGALTFEINGSAIATMTGSTGALAMTGGLSGDGGDTLVGFLESNVASTSVSITAAQCGSTFVSNSADVMVLPEASTVLGCRLTFISGTADDFDINPADGTDQILALNSCAASACVSIAPAAGDAVRLTDIGTSLTLQAIGNDAWAVVGAANGAITDVN